MTQKKEISALLITLGITGFCVIIGVTFLLPKFNLSPNSSNNPTPTQESKNDDSIAQISPIPEGKFFYGGSSTWASIRKEVDDKIQLIVPQFKLIYKDPTNSAPSSETGIKMLIDNQLDIAQSSEPVPTKYYEQAQKKGFTLQEIPVAIDAKAVIVHPSLDIKGLTVQQIKDIYDGKIINWQQVGGPNLEIHPYSKYEKANPPQIFVPTTTVAIRKVSEDRGGIFEASASLLVSQCGVKPIPLGIQEGQYIPPYQEPFIPPSECPQRKNTLNISAFTDGTYPKTRRLFVIIKKDGQRAEQAGQSYAKMLLSKQGQDLIEQAGFVKIR